jgi:hypothetical protein
LGGGQGHWGGSEPHPPTSTINANRMWVIYLEVVLALGLAAFIVWFTWPKKRK